MKRIGTGDIAAMGTRSLSRFYVKSHCQRYRGGASRWQPARHRILTSFADPTVCVLWLLLDERFRSQGYAWPGRRCRKFVRLTQQLMMATAPVRLRARTLIGLYRRQFLAAFPEPGEPAEAPFHVALIEKEMFRRMQEEGWDRTWEDFRQALLCIDRAWYGDQHLFDTLSTYGIALGEPGELLSEAESAPCSGHAPVS